MSGGGYGNTASGSTSVVAGGYGNLASGSGSTVGGGQQNIASGTFATVIGGNAAVASAIATIAGGNSISATGNYSVALGNNLNAPAMSQTTLGSYNLSTGSETASNWVATDPLLIVGNGTSASTLSNALMLLKNGNMGLGLNAPAAKLDVAGQIHGQVYNAGTSTSIDWNNGNSQYTAPSGAACAAFTFANLLDGGSYSLAVQSVTSGTCTFAQSGLTFVYSPANAAVSADAVYSFLRMGSKVYVSWVTGFQ